MCVLKISDAKITFLSLYIVWETNSLEEHLERISLNPTENQFVELISIVCI